MSVIEDIFNAFFAFCNVKRIFKGKRRREKGEGKPSEGKG